MPGSPEFSRPVPLAQLGREPHRQRIEATPAEREALARRFGLLALDRLAADVTLARQPAATILLQARFEAEFVQECVVSLDPVRGALGDEFQLRYGPPEAAPAELDAAVEEPAFEPLEGDAIDIGEAVAQELSLALPWSPRLPDADLEPPAAEAPADSPFAVLRKLAKN